MFTLDKELVRICESLGYTNKLKEWKKKEEREEVGKNFNEDEAAQRKKAAVFNKILRGRESLTGSLMPLARWQLKGRDRILGEALHLAGIAPMAVDLALRQEFSEEENYMKVFRLVRTITGNEEGGFNHLLARAVGDLRFKDEDSLD